VIPRVLELEFYLTQLTENEGGDDGCEFCLSHTSPTPYTVQQVPASSGELVHDALRLDLITFSFFFGALHSLQATSFLFC
jgi:hypothetical protein